MKHIDEKELLLAVGEVGDDLIARAEQPVKGRKAVYVRWGALAACFCLIAVLAVLPGRLGMTAGNNMAGPPQSNDMNAGGGNDEEASEGEDKNQYGADLQPVPGDPGAPDGLVDGAVESAPPDDGSGGTNQESVPTSGSKGAPVLIDPADTSLQVVHIRGGQMEERTVTGDALEALHVWAEELLPGLEERSFDPGETPGDSDGGEVYTFAGAGTSFSYVINGPADCWVAMDGVWYAVANPADPPVLFAP